jgi:peptide/nickel transport system substrate-binding protein
MTRALRPILFLAAVVLLAPAVAAAQPSGAVTVAAHITLATRWLDPAETDSEITPFMIFYALHDALVKPMPTALNAPSLAESWTMSKDGRTWEFVLRKGTRFHNGDPVTAEDVKFSFERYRGAAAPILKDRVRDVQVVDPGRVRFHLKDPWPDFMTFYGTSASGAAWIVPKKYLEKVGEDGFRRAPIGAGPYKFVSFQPGIELVLEAFDGYWRKTPSVKRLVMRSIPEESTRAAALKRGEVDIAYFLNGPIAEDVRRTPGLTLTAMRTNGVLFLMFPEQWTAGSPWADRRVRMAASLAVDRQAINEAESLGFSAPTGNIVPRHQEFALPIAADPYDPKRAKVLLAEAGFPNGFDAGEFPRSRPTTRWVRPSRATSPRWASGRGCGRWSARPCCRPGGTRSSRPSSWAPPAPPGTPLPASRRSRPARACCPTEPSRSSTRCSRRSSRRWTARSARRCSTRSSASSRSAWSSRRSGRTGSSAHTGRAWRKPR